MRIKNSIKNIYIGIASQIIIILLGFISRKVFLDTLGAEYLGVNGLLTNVLSILGLVEAGIGTSIVYNIYKPLADKDESKIIALVQLYKKLYGILAIIIFILSICIYPFMRILINESESITNLTLVYFIFVINNMITYINAHKWSLINADQKGYVLAKYNLLFNIVTTITKIIILKSTGSYVLFLISELLIFIVKNLWNGKIVNKRYPYIKTKQKYIIENNIKDNITKNVKAIFIQNIGKQCIYGTDNILIAMLIDVKTVGLYSNYSMITGQMWSLINIILDGVSASVGNLIAIERQEKKYEIFNVIYLVNFWIYSFCTITLFIILEPFINWWIGSGMLLDKLTFTFILINFYISGLRTSISMFKEKAGIFDEDKYIRLIEAAVNLIASFIFAKIYGLAGIFMGTAFSSVTIALWVQSKLVYNKVFNKSVLEYFKKYAFYLILTIIVGGITKYTCLKLVNYSGFISILLKGMISLILVNGIYVIIFFKSKQFKYLISIAKNIVSMKGKGRVLN